MTNTVEIYNKLIELINKDYNSYLNRHKGCDYFIHFEEFKQIAENASLEVLNYNDSRLLFDALNFANPRDNNLEKYFTRYAILLIELGANPFCEDVIGRKYYKCRENNINIISAINTKYREISLVIC
jgi:hypothetical protein